MRNGVWRTFSLCIAVVVPLSLGCAEGGAVGDDAGGTVDAPPGDIDAGTDANDVSCSKSPCDILEECGCDDPQVCDLNVDELPTGGTECRDVTAPGTEQAACGMLSECAEGYVCLGGQCRNYCADDVECGADAFCNLNIVYTDQGGNQQQVPGAVTCSKNCTPEATINNNCPDGFGCNIFVADQGLATEYFHTDCHRAGAGTNGANCVANGIRDCAAGYLCVIFSQNGVETGRECRQNCRVVGGSCATGGQACAAFTGGGATVNGIEYGFCD